MITRPVSDRQSAVAKLLATAFRDASAESYYDADELAAQVLKLADDLMTPGDMAIYLGKPKATVQALYRRQPGNGIPIAITVGERQPLFYRPDVVTWAGTHRSLVPSDAPVLADLKPRRKQT